MIVVGAAAAFAQLAAAQPAHDGPKAAPGKDEKAKDEKKPEEKTSRTKHTIQIGGKELKYTATAGTSPVSRASFCAVSARSQRAHLQPHRRGAGAAVLRVV